MFHTPSGRRVPAVDADGMREVDRVAVEEVGLELLMMMENAGRGLAAAAREALVADGDHVGAGPVVVLAGGGGNGGGGLCAARHLANRGTDVRVVLDRPVDALSDAPATQRRVLDAADVPVAAPSRAGDGVDTDADAEADADAAVPAAPALVIDALVGYGLAGTLDGRTAALVDVAAARDAPVVSLDVPSGVDATTGATAGPAVVPDRTLTLALPKTGLASAATGALDLADVGIPAGAFARAGVDYVQPFDGRAAVRLRVADGDAKDPS